MASIKDRRKKFMDHLCHIMDLLDPTGANSKRYRDKFDKMTDTEFDTYIKRFLENDKANLYLEIVEYERDITIENIEKCAQYMKVPLFERVAMPYLTNDPNNVIVTPEPVPVGYIHEKRMPQTLLKKSAGSTSISKRNPITGQVVGEDKNARNTDMETYGLLTMGAEKAAKEFLGPRADDTQAKVELYNSIAQNGFASLDELTDDPYYKTSLNTFNVYLLAQGIASNLVGELGEIPTVRDRK